MPARIIDGRAVAAEVRAECRTRVQRLNERFGIVPGLAVVLVGENPASVVYVRNKVRACADVGIRSSKLQFAGMSIRQSSFEQSNSSTAIPISTEFWSSSRSRSTSD